MSNPGLKKFCKQGHLLKDTQIFVGSAKTRVCGLCRTARKRKWISDNLAEEIKKRWIRRLKRHYNLTPTQYDGLLEKQGSVCGICGTNKFGPFGPHIDHCHTSGKVRGILCHYCNPALGMFRDSPEILRKAARYLEENG